MIIILLFAQLQKDSLPKTMTNHILTKTANRQQTCQNLWLLDQIFHKFNLSLKFRLENRTFPKIPDEAHLVNLVSQWCNKSHRGKNMIQFSKHNSKWWLDHLKKSKKPRSVFSSMFMTICSKKNTSRMFVPTRMTMQRHQSVSLISKLKKDRKHPFQPRLCNQSTQCNICSGKKGWKSSSVAVKTQKQTAEETLISKFYLLRTQIASSASKPNRSKSL